MKILAKPTKFRITSSHVYGYEGGPGSHLEYMYTDQYGAKFYDCVEDTSGFMQCDTACLYVWWNGEWTPSCGN